MVSESVQPSEQASEGEDERNVGLQIEKQLEVEGEKGNRDTKSKKRTATGTAPACSRNQVKGKCMIFSRG